MTSWKMKLPLGSVPLGSGNTESSFCPLGSIRFVGTMFPGKGLPEIGSRIVVDNAEKSPLRCACVGTFTCTILCGVLVGRISWEKKKNSLSLCGKTLGIKTGPPKLYPHVLNQNGRAS